MMRNPPQENFSRVCLTAGNAGAHTRTMTTMRSVLTLSLAVGVTLAALQPLQAQSSRGIVEAGRRLAIDWCSGCHSVAPKTVGIFAADFAEVAKLPSTTALSLKVFLRSNHRSMPNFILQPAEADNIIAYILSLKRK
jgi:mono/diheme cytochrome c family protein